MKKSTFFIFTGYLLMYFSFSTAQVLLPDFNANNSVLLNGIWKFNYVPSVYTNLDSTFFRTDFDTQKWNDINTPGSWELQGFAKPSYGLNLEAGTGLYVRNFFVSKAWKNDRVFLAFESVCFGYELWINGEKIGDFSGSFNRQSFDITRFVRFGQTNKLALKVSTRVKGWEFDTNDDWSLSGISGDVRLFVLPNIYFDDVTIQTNLAGKNAATVGLKVDIYNTYKTKKSGKYTLKAVLTDANNVQAASVSVPVVADGKNTLSISSKLLLNNPKLWTAETPNLYQLTLSINNYENVIQSKIFKIGIREIEWTKGSLKINNVEVKLRGVNYHMLSPITGRYITESELNRDLMLIKKANCNLIRTSHYPNHPRLTQLCDSMGIYVIDEVPFGFGDSNLKDSSYLPILKKRAYHTIRRDKNSPSVIVWSVGNENKITDNGLRTGLYVKQLDKTRPFCFPSVGSYFKSVMHNYPDEVDVLAPHYPSENNLKEYDQKFNRPIIVTEYAHDFGLDFDRLEVLTEEMHRSKHIAGGAVWHFFDQGILQKSDTAVDKTKFTPYVWKDSVTYYDCFLDKGTDGVVYADRTPQVDYWQLRKVFAPIRVLPESVQLIANVQKVDIEIENRLDFSNMYDVKVNWKLYADSKEIQQASFYLNILPKSKKAYRLDIAIPENTNARFYYVKLEFTDKDNYCFYEKSILLNNRQKPLSTFIGTDFFDILPGASTSNPVCISTQKFPNLLDELQLRVGRKPTLCNWIDTDNTSEDSVNISDKKAWFPHVIRPVACTNTQSSGGVLSYKLRFERKLDKRQYFEGNINFITTDSGYIRVAYKIKPINTRGIFLETGISFQLPASISEFRFAGNGPYPSYPGKSALSEFGIYHLTKNDLNFEGNYANVKLATLTNKQGEGLLVEPLNGSIAVEKTESGILLSHNAAVSGRYSKKSSPNISIKAENGNMIEGSFKIYSLGSIWNAELIRIFGLPQSEKIPFVPFYHSYN